MYYKRRLKPAATSIGLLQEPLLTEKLAVAGCYSENDELILACNDLQYFSVTFDGFFYYFAGQYGTRISFIPIERE